MLLSELDFEFPESQIALEPSRPSRVAWTEPHRAPVELTTSELLSRFGPEDLMVINETKVIPARLFSNDGAEILFLRALSTYDWEVLFPARDFSVGDVLRLPDDVEATLVAKNLPQTLALSKALTLDYFHKHGEMALPPYIQQARGERHNRPEDASRYQAQWASAPGSVAAPTASLHFTNEQISRLPNVARVVLHVGAGTFFPIRTTDIREHKMHAETIEVPGTLPAQIEQTRWRGGRVWALGTTVARTLESIPLLCSPSAGDKDCERWTGETRLFIYPPYTFKNVDVLLTNFHQPKSSLLALVAAFAGLPEVRRTYDFAIQRGFKLFSYGDLSGWSR